MCIMVSGIAGSQTNLIEMFVFPCSDSHCKDRWSQQCAWKNSHISRVHVQHSVTAPFFYSSQNKTNKQTNNVGVKYLVMGHHSVGHLIAA